MSPSAMAGPYRASPPPPDDVPPRAEWRDLRVEPSDILFPARACFEYRVGGTGNAWHAARVDVVGKTGNGRAFTADDVREAVEGYVRARLAEYEMCAPITAGEIR